MARITFQQGVALAMGAYIDPAASTNNKTFNLVGENASATYNVNGVFSKAPLPTGAVITNRLSALLHGRLSNETDMTPLDFATLPMSGLGASGNLASLVFRQWRSTDVGGSGGIPAEAGLFIGGDVDEEGDPDTVSQTEKNLHRTGLAIWNKLKK